MKSTISGGRVHGIVVRAKGQVGQTPALRSSPTTRTDSTTE